jgi:transposase
MIKKLTFSPQELKRKECSLLLKCGLDKSQISKALDISDRTIRRMKKKKGRRYQSERKPGSKAPKKLLKEQKLSIYQTLRQNPFLSCTDIKNKLNLSVSIETIRLYLVSAGFKRKRPEGKLQLTQEHIDRRLIFAREMISSPYIPEIIFTDETSVWLHDNNHEGWFHSNSVHELSVDKHSGKIQVFGAINLMIGKVFLWTFQEYLKTPLMIEILRDGLIPQGDYFFPDGWLLAHDNGPQFTSGETQQFLNHNGPYVIKWPAKSPDLNPIEQAWHLLKQRVRKCLPQTLENLEIAITEEWEKIDDTILMSLCENFKSKLDKCISLRGRQIE